MNVLTGLDVLAEDQFRPLQGLRLGLIANHTAISRHREHLLGLLLAAGCDVRALFSPEHGFAGSWMSQCPPECMSRPEFRSTACMEMRRSPLLRF